MDRAYVSELERGLLLPSLETIFKLSPIIKNKAP
jgi:transcriptional regulator with XRE-family HTH domain